MINYFGLFFLILSCSLLLLNPYYGVLATFFSKPIIDAAFLGYISFLRYPQIIGFAVPVLILPRIIIQKGRLFFSSPLAIIATIYLFSNIFAFVLIFNKDDFIGSINFALRILNGYLGFFMIPHYFKEKTRLKSLLLVLIFSGFMPVGTGLYQFFTGHVWHVRIAAGLLRNVGLYHDAVAMRIPVLQTLTAIFLYWAYFAGRSKLIKLLLIGYTLAGLVVIYKTYSKAAIAIIISWAIIWIIFKRKFSFLILIPLFIFAINFATGGKLFVDITDGVYSKEIGAIEGESDSRLALGGRMGVWAYYMDRWMNTDTLHQLFGLGESGGKTHNDYLRALISNGLIGLGIYIALLFIVGTKVIKLVMKDKTPLNIMALMIYSSWMIDTIGTQPGLYPGYQWYVWGFICLALTGVEGLDEKPVPETEYVRQYITPFKRRISRE